MRSVLCWRAGPLPELDGAGRGPLRQKLASTWLYLFLERGECVSGETSSVLQHSELSAGEGGREGGQPYIRLTRLGVLVASLVCD